MIHHLPSVFPKPRRFTFPFCYEPHPLCIAATDIVCEYIQNNGEIKDDAGKGKMFGVMIVEDNDRQTGFIAAYSGMLAGRNDWDFFVPPIFDAQQENGYFKTHEAKITAVNKAIERIEGDEDFALLRRNADEARKEAMRKAEEYKTFADAAKRRRDARRNSGVPLSTEEYAEMTRESQYMKAELRRIKKRGEELVRTTEKDIAAYEERITKLKMKRKTMSDALQRWLFNQYIVLNACGERTTLTKIFATTPQRVPPAGAGDCCAPKLLQYAYLNGLRPVCMAEFWWGAAPKTGIRHHLNYYPACSGKCKPILGFMMQGLNVDPDPQTTYSGHITDSNCHSTDGHIGGNKWMETVYEDEWITVVNKPAGMLSVPGKSECISVEAIMRARYPEATGPLIVHRLDMDTSGLMIIAKTKEAHKLLQQQFKRHEIKKRYVALLEKPMQKGKGRVTLPLVADILDRPRQIVDYVDGKTAITEYEVIGEKDGHALITLYPHTGRTHQLRVHCAHPSGLNNPILGDPLYGTVTAGRLYLHAEAITFAHPVTGKRIKIDVRSSL